VYFVGLFYLVACSSDVILQQMKAKRADLLRRIIAVDWALIRELNDDVLLRNRDFLFFTQSLNN
jgi:hypothetical protein